MNTHMTITFPLPIRLMRRITYKLMLKCVNRYRFNWFLYSVDFNTMMYGSHKLNWKIKVRFKRPPKPYKWFSIDSETNVAKLTQFNVYAKLPLFACLVMFLLCCFGNVKRR